jgi:hypothetical protein
MSARELLLLSPYRFPTHSTVYLGDEDVAAFLNAVAALWHPAAVLGAAGPPRVASPYDHETPTAGHVYAVPESPPALLPDDWEHRVREAGAVAFRTVTARPATFANLADALRRLPAEFAPAEGLLNAPAAQAAPFLGVGLGFHAVEALFEAMSHENLLAVADLWQDVQNAAAALHSGDPAESRRHLEAAAQRLLEAREVLYAAPIHLIDLLLLDESSRIDHPWPSALEKGSPLTVLAPGCVIERLAAQQPQRLALLRERLSADLAEVIGGPYREREDAILPLESQLWNLLRGQRAYREHLGQEVRVFGRKRFGATPQLPALLQGVGIGKALLVAFDDVLIPAHRTTVVSWPASDGKQVDIFTRAPHPADSPQTYFHLAYHVHQTVMQDMAATLVLGHRDKTAPPGSGAAQPQDEGQGPGAAANPWYDDLLELARLAPVLGKFTTLSGYFGEVMAGDYSAPVEADEFQDNYLVERTPEGDAVGPWATDRPLSGLAERARTRRRLDTLWTVAGLARSLGTGDPSLPQAIAALEDRLEAAPEEKAPAEAGTPAPTDSGEAPAGAGVPAFTDPQERAAEQEWRGLLDRAARPLAQRLVARGPAQPGYLLLNPCSFTRRVLLEVPDCPHLLPLEGPVKACQLDGATARAVVELPALGFAWVPARGNPNEAPSSKRMKLADERAVRNEFLEAEIDQGTGGLRALRDHRTRTARVGQQLVYNPGSVMRATGIRVTSTGPALGEIVTEGVLLDAHEQELARFRQRFQAWLGRPVLDVQIEIQPTQAPHGFPWHAYFGSRFAWREERAALLRGVCGAAYVTGHTRPTTPDYLELRVGSQNTVLFPGGLPYHQRHGTRMLDVLLITPGETQRTFQLALSLDRPSPQQTAQGLLTPVVAVPTTQGPPHIGATGWLFHLDAPNLMLTEMRPAADGENALEARLQEITGYGGSATLRCVRDPKQARSVDARGTPLADLPVQGDAVQLEFGRNEVLTVRVEF